MEHPGLHNGDYYMDGAGRQRKVKNSKEPTVRMSSTDSKKKSMASKMGNVGQNSHKKDTIKSVGSMKNSSRKMP